MSYGMAVAFHFVCCIWLRQSVMSNWNMKKIYIYIFINLFLKYELIIKSMLFDLY